MAATPQADGEEGNVTGPTPRGGATGEERLPREEESVSSKDEPP